MEKEFSDEIQGISLALQILKKIHRARKLEAEGSYLHDSQAITWSIAKAIAEHVKTLQKIGQLVTLRLIQAHTSISGNQAVDRAAKYATAWREDGRRYWPTDAPSRLYAIR